MNITRALVSFPSFFSLVAFLRWKKDIVIRIVDKHTILVSYKYQAERQDTKSIDKRSRDLSEYLLRLN